MGDLTPIISTTYGVSLMALILAFVCALPLAWWLYNMRSRWGKILTLTINTLTALPTVFVGLMLYLLFSRYGPLSFLEILHTPLAMIAGQWLLALPIISALALSAFQRLDPSLDQHLRALGAGSHHRLLILSQEIRGPLLAAVVVAFGRIVTEVGAALILGGNIVGQTRTITTAIALETHKGDLSSAVFLGVLLLATSSGLNFFFVTMQRPHDD